jgi:hypothetical protein
MLLFAIGDDVFELPKLCRRLRSIANKKLQERDAEAVVAAIEKLMLFQGLRSEIRQLVVDLQEIELEHQTDAAQYPDQWGGIDLAASTLALSAVLEFLRPIPSRNLSILLKALAEMGSGASPPAMFRPEYRKSGRRPDPLSVMAAKGTLAGMMHSQMAGGMSREEAAQWIVRNISPLLASRISTKPLIPGVVEGWLDRFGGNFAERNVGRERYLLWREHDSVDSKRFREITYSMAQKMPSRNPG